MVPSFPNRGRLPPLMVVPPAGNKSFKIIYRIYKRFINFTSHPLPLQYSGNLQMARTDHWHPLPLGGGSALTPAGNDPRPFCRFPAVRGPPYVSSVPGTIYSLPVLYALSSVAWPPTSFQLSWRGRPIGYHAPSRPASSTIPSDASFLGPPCYATAPAAAPAELLLPLRRVVPR